MEQNLTEKQRFFLRYLEKQIAAQGRAPSLRRAADDLGVSHAAVSQMLSTLEQKGVVRREGRYSRTVRVLQSSDAPGSLAASGPGRSVPVVGSISAGLPLYAQQVWDGAVVVDPEMFPGSNLFALRVKGDSMKNAGILNGDLAICRPRQFAENAEIVVALVNGEEATVKRFFLHENQIELRPENPAFDSQFYGFDQVLVQGRVVGAIRPPEVMETL